MNTIRDQIRKYNMNQMNQTPAIVVDEPYSQHVVDYQAICLSTIEDYRHHYNSMILDEYNKRGS